VLLIDVWHPDLTPFEIQALQFDGQPWSFTTWLSQQRGPENKKMF
jgi:hypothetical protein